MEGSGKRGDQHDSGKRQQDDVRSANIVAGKGQLAFRDIVPPDFRSLQMLSSLDAAIADAVRTSLGPRGMDKMV